ncbi:MAG: hypothetical protein LH614_03275 [Pyrinomonadaceae bacterium]|nr:hypothetical protein [Pyrinomonadaceae bacterium]
MWVAFSAIKVGRRLMLFALDVDNDVGILLGESLNLRCRIGEIKKFEYLSYNTRVENCSDEKALIGRTNKMIVPERSCV